MADSDDGVSSGLYRIVNALTINGGTSGSLKEYSLDCFAAKVGNFTNVEIYESHNYDAQIWYIRKHSEEGYEIVNRYTGQCMDAEGGNIVNGTNIMMYWQNNSRAQRWDFKKTGNTVIYNKNGITYPIYHIVLNADKRFGVDVYGNYGPGSDEFFTNRKNIMLWELQNPAPDQQWVLIPVEEVRDEGVYELIPLSDLTTNYENDIINMNDAPRRVDSIYGVRHPQEALCLAQEDSSGGNRQKFIFKKNADGSYLIRQTSNLDQALAHLDNDPNIYIKDSYNSERYSENMFKWSIVESVLVNGKDRKYQGISITPANHPATETEHQQFWYADAKTTGSKLQLAHGPRTNPHFIFLMKPTTVLDSSVPLVYDLHFTNKENTINYDYQGMYLYSSKDSNHKVYPEWKLSSSLTNTAYGFVLNARMRKMSAETGIWGEWTKTIIDAQVLVSKNVKTYRFEDGIELSFDSSKWKAMELQIGIQLTMADSDKQITLGNSVNDSIFVYQKPNVTFSEAMWSPLGLQLAVKNDYNSGITRVKLKSIKDVNGKEYLVKEYLIPNVYGDTVSMIPADVLTGFDFDDQSELTIQYMIGSDMYKDDNVLHTWKIKPTLESNHGYSVKGTYSAWKKYTLRAEFDKIENLKGWINYQGVQAELKWVEEKSKYVFYIPYPFGKNFTLCFIARNVKGTQWGYLLSKFTPSTEPINTYGQYAHVWNWYEGDVPKTAVIEIQEDNKLHTEANYSMRVSEHAMFARKNSAITKDRSRTGRFTSEGWLLFDDTISKPNDFIDLLAQEYVIYRAPAEVFVRGTVSDVKPEIYDDHCKISVTTVEEGDPWM